MTGLAHSEMRREAWRLARGSAFGRLFASILLLFGLWAAVTWGADWACRHCGVQTWESFAQLQQRFAAQGLALSPPSRQAFWQMTGASAFLRALYWLFGGLATFGMAAVVLKTVRGQAEGWMSAAFGGFGRPLEMFWLNALMMCRIFLWSLLLVVPGIVAAFRYAVAWYVKSDRPELSAAQCLAESGRLMDGHKMELFAYGLPFAFWGVLAVLPAVAGTALSGRAPASVCYAMLALALAALVVVCVWSAVAQGVFYRELARADGQSNGEGNGED